MVRKGITGAGYLLLAKLLVNEYALAVGSACAKAEAATFQGRAETSIKCAGAEVRPP